MRVVDSDFLPQIFPRFFIFVRLSPLPHKSILVHSAQKNSHNFIVFAEMMQMEQKIVDFFSIKVYLRIKIWIQNQISYIKDQTNTYQRNRTKYLQGGNEDESDNNYITVSGICNHHVHA